MANVETIATSALHNRIFINQFAIIGHLLFIKDTNTLKELLLFIKEFYLQLFDNNFQIISIYYLQKIIFKSYNSNFNIRVNINININFLFLF